VLANPPIQQRLGCASQAGADAEIAEQAFEHGSMVWYGKPLEQIYVLVGSDSGTWHVFEQSALLGQPLPTPAAPPTGRVAPSSSFELIWGSQPSVQTQLGWGVRPEDGPFAGVLQSFTGGTLLFSPVGLGRGGSITVLFGDGTFRRFDVPNQ
jgi:serine/threonine-protein kinase